MNARVLTPEILDGLPPESPEARRSRRDLRVINRVLGNARWFRRTLARRARAGEAVLEIGSGDGELARGLMEADGAKGGVRTTKSPSSRSGLQVAGLDLVPRPAGWPSEAAWWQASVFDFAGWEAYQVVIGNLVFHHFTEGELAAIGRKIDAGGARLVVASEPVRSRRAAWGFRLLCPLIGADAVTRHDGRVSIEAGFAGEELPRMLGLDAAAWRWDVGVSALGAYRLVAERRAC